MIKKRLGAFFHVVKLLCCWQFWCTDCHVGDFEKYKIYGRISNARPYAIVGFHECH